MTSAGDQDQAKTSARDAKITTRQDKGGLILAFAGRWTTPTLNGEDEVLSEIAIKGARRARIDLSALEALDTAGAWLIHRTQRGLDLPGTEYSPAMARLPPKHLRDTRPASRLH